MTPITEGQIFNFYIFIDVLTSSFAFCLFPIWSRDIEFSIFTFSDIIVRLCINELTFELYCIQFFYMICTLTCDQYLEVHHRMQGYIYGNIRGWCQK